MTQHQPMTSVPSKTSHKSVPETSWSEIPSPAAGSPNRACAGAQMLVLDAQSPGSVAYNVQDALRLTGDVDAAALQVPPSALAHPLVQIA